MGCLLHREQFYVWFLGIIHRLNLLYVYNNLSVEVLVAKGLIFTEPSQIQPSWDQSIADSFG